MPGSHEYHWQRRRRFKRQSVRDGPHIAGPCHRNRCQPEHRQAEHPVARRHMRDAAAHGDDHARHFVTKDAGIGRFCRIERQRLEHIAEIHARGFHLDGHLAGATSRQGEGDQAQRIQQPALAGLQPQRDRGIQHLFARLQTAVNAPDITSLAAECNLAFGVLFEQFVPQPRAIVSRSDRRQVHRPAGEIVIFIGHHTQQADGRRLCQCHLGIAAECLGTARHPIDAQFGHG